MDIDDFNCESFWIKIFIFVQICIFIWLVYDLIWRGEWRILGTLHNQANAAGSIDFLYLDV